MTTVMTWLRAIRPDKLMDMLTYANSPASEKLSSSTPQTKVGGDDVFDAQDLLAEEAPTSKPVTAAGVPSAATSGSSKVKVEADTDEVAEFSATGIAMASFSSSSSFGSGFGRGSRAARREPGSS